MSQVNLLFGRKTSLTSTSGFFLLTFDAVVNSTATYQNSVTRFPVEDGLDITDHIRQEPERLRIEGIVSGSPLDDTPGTKRWLDAYEILLTICGRRMLKSITQKQIAGKPRLIDVVDGVRVWTDMVIETLETTRDSTTGDSLRVSLDMVNVRKASLGEININYVNTKTYGTGLADQTSPTEDGGKQQSEIPGFDEKDSWALQAYKWANKSGQRQSTAVKEILIQKYGIGLLNQ